MLFRVHVTGTKTHTPQHETTMKTPILIAALCVAIIEVVAAGAGFDTAKIDQITGLKGKWNDKERVYRVTFPRNDVKVTVDGWSIPPFMGLGTWAAFIAVENDVMVMGDTRCFLRTK
jgi:hypothetical protein